MKESQCLKFELIEKHVLQTLADHIRYSPILEASLADLIRSQAVPEQARSSKRSYPAAAWICGRIFWLRRKRLSGSYAALTTESLV